MPDSVRIEHFLGTFMTSQSNLGQSKPDFVFAYLHFNVPPTRIADLVGNVPDEKMDLNGTITFAYAFDFIKLG